VLIHRVSTEGIGVLCQLESEGNFRAELVQWMPGYRVDETVPEDAALAAEEAHGPEEVPAVTSPAAAKDLQ